MRYDTSVQHRSSFSFVDTSMGPVQLGVGIVHHFSMHSVFNSRRTHLLDDFSLLAGVSIHAYVAQKLCQGRECNAKVNEYKEVKTQADAPSKEGGRGIQVLLRGQGS